MPTRNYREQFGELSQENQQTFLEIQEALIKGYEDPVFFSEYFLGVPLHSGQKKYLRVSDVVFNPNTTRKTALVPCNRWGKTVALAIKHIRYNFYKIGVPRETEVSSIRDMRYGTLDLSPHSHQVQGCFNYIFDILHSRFVTVIDGKRTVNKCRISPFFKSKNESRHTIDFSNNSSFFGASTGEDQAASLAGRQFGYISYDECVFSHHLRDELPGRIMSRTVDLNAPIDLVSTFDRQAKSQQYFFGLVKRGLAGKNEWQVVQGVYTDNEFIPTDIKEEAKKKIMAEDFNMYRQVFLGEAIPASTKVFDPEMVNNIFRDDLYQQQPLHNHEYLISVDWGGSDQGDPTVMLVIDCTAKPYTIVFHYKEKGGNPVLQFSLLKTLKMEYNDARVIMDTNSLGGVLIKKLLKGMGVKTFDFNAHGGEKGEAVTQLKLALTYNRKYQLVNDKVVDLEPNYGIVRSYYIPELEDQLGAYEIEDDKLEQDFVAALYQAIWFLEKKNKKARTIELTRRVR